MYKHLLLTLSVIIIFVISCNIDKSPLFPDITEFPAQLTTSQKDFIPYWSPDGEYIAFKRIIDSSNPLSSALLFELWIMNRNGYYQHPIISRKDFQAIDNIVHVITLVNGTNNLFV